jgi:hypothetical protein
MIPACRLLHEKFNVFNSIALNETCVIIIANVAWISRLIVTR